ncbi:MAG: hypothetical protein KatS3mg057_1008 [Herpetosiphonaceae bacterium]|nr:MAG: hypothetical protein KatS3mg057_1008 [Herpetosiphonaceae bacterium]
MSQQSVAQWFEHARSVFESAYTQHSEPWKQSGMSGPEERWVALRKPVADCMTRSGSFLDIGCANGYLLECCLRWCAERGISIDPYGLDLSPQFVELARQRLPQFADHFFIGNSLNWIPPRKFDFVRTELVYVPADYEKQYINHLFEHYLEHNGKLLVAHYQEGTADPTKGILAGSHPTRYILDRLAELGFQPVGYCDGYDTLKGRKTRVAVLEKPG